MVVKAQQTATDSLQKRLSKAVSSLAADSTVLDSLKNKKVSKSTLAKSSLNDAALKKHSPRKAAYYSLMFPGLGQAYNRQYWKMPFVYGGLGAVAYFIRFYHIRYQDFLWPYYFSYDVTTGKQLRTEAEVFLRGQNQTRTLTLDRITQGKDFYRRYRDLNFLLVVGVWALAAVEANVSAHLKTFDMSEDLSFRFEPDTYNNSFTGQVYGVKVVVPIK
ncbi:MAG TPA: hypothetical protein DCM71_07385 [Runella sp.]|nr:hypothetical protein [Runella sp.]